MGGVRSEVSLGLRHNGIFYFLFFIYSSSPAHLYLIPISPPDLHQQKRKMLELAPPPRPMVGRIMRMSAFSAKPENETARCRSVQIFHQPGGHYGHCKPSCSCYKSVMRLHDCSPSVFAVSNPPLQFVRRQCLLLPTRSFPGRPRTPVRANFLARGALSTASR